MKNKFIKRVLNFYLPSKMQFVNIDWTAESGDKDKSFIYAKVGYLLLK